MSNLSKSFPMPLSSVNRLENLPWFSGLSMVQIAAGYSWHLAREVINRSLVRDIGPLYQLWVHMYISATGLSGTGTPVHGCCVGRQLN